MIRVLLSLALIVVVLLAVMVWLYMNRQNAPAVLPLPTAVPEETQPRESAMYQVYDGVLVREDGSRVTLAQLRGKPVLLVFWSSWCPDCRAFLEKDVSDVFGTLRAQGGEAFLVCREGRRGETWDTALEKLRTLKVQEPTLMDPDAALFETMGLRSVPTAVLLDEAGRLMVATTHMPGQAEAMEMLALLEMGHEGRTAAFLRDAVVAASGAVASTYGAQGDRVVPGQDVLSESQGLLMLYAVRAGDQDLFDQLLSYVRNEMTVAGLNAWRISDGERGAVNASLDDLRILEALALAEDAWGGYRQELLYRSSALYRRTVKDGFLRDYASLEKAETAQAVTLCYMDIAAMETLGRYDERWNAVADNARQVLSGGVISAEFPLFHPRYDPENDTYCGDSLQMNEALVAVYNAARAGLDCTAALDWLEEQMLSGGIFARYDLNGRPMRGYVYESTATYALLVQAALHAGREDLAQQALARLERRRCFTAPLAGDMGEVGDGLHYTFDLLETLLAWQQWNKHTNHTY